MCTHTFCMLLHCFDMLLCPDLRMKTASSSSWGSNPTSFLTRNTYYYRNCYYRNIIGTITFCVTLTLCGQLSSSNQSALFILSYQQPVTYTFIIDRSIFTFDPALSFPVICVKCYIGPYGVLVPTGTVCSNNEYLNLNL